MRVPLATFVVDGPVNDEGNTTCIFQMTNLGTSDDSEIVLGGMFFQQFFGVFTNDYSAVNVTQTA
jgi:hypothetical protein